MGTVSWAVSFPECNEELICKTNGDIIGHICHIVAQSVDGPHGDSSKSTDFLYSADNLILLCPTHHKIVDSDTDTYTVERLTKIKLRHAELMYNKTHTGSPWKINFSQFYYINIPRLSILAAINGIILNFEFMELFTCLHSVGFQLNYLMLKFKRVLETLTIQSIPLTGDFSKLEVGQTVEFSHKFRTKNMPSPNKVSNGEFGLTNKWESDPHIYLKSNNKKLVLTLDPTWVTTSTSFSNFANGWINVSGIAIIKKITSTHIFASPYILGTPKTVFDYILENKDTRSIDIP